MRYKVIIRYPTAANCTITFETQADSEKEARNTACRTVPQCSETDILSAYPIPFDPANLKTIDINALEWFDKVNGNSYFAGTVTVNYGMPDEQTFNMPFQYGYGSQYEQEAFKVLAEAGLTGYNDWGKNNRQPWGTSTLREKGVIVRSHIQKNCKQRELKAIK